MAKLLDFREHLLDNYKQVLNGVLRVWKFIQNSKEKNLKHHNFTYEQNQMMKKMTNFHLILNKMSFAHK